MLADRGVAIRRERREDRKGIRTVNNRAFEGPNEARLVDRLRSNDRVLLSLVAEYLDPNGSPRIVGHILFSEALLFSKGGFSRPTVALAPMAVLPEFQCQGVGSRLVKSGLQELRELGHQAVFVLGHSTYYPRFGFQAADRFGIRCQFEVPDEAFMAIELQPKALQKVEGELRYALEFSE